MKFRGYLWTTVLVNIFCISFPIESSAQDSRGAYNTINVYIGVFDRNINYERSIINHPKSISNIRMGFGYGQFLVAGEGRYINPAFVHLMGRRNSHLEINLGIKYMLTNSISDPSFFETFVPDVAVGYRYQRSGTGFIFRALISYATFINLGVGYKF